MSIKEKPMIKNIVSVYDRLYENASAETGNRTYFFLAVSIIGGGLFFLSFFLADANPFRLLLPGSLHDFSFSARDKRKKAEVFLADAQKKVFTSERKVFLSGDFKRDLVSLITEVGEPPYYETEENLNKKDLNTNFKKLPNLHYALITFWKRDGLLILDFREETLNSEMEAIKVDTSEVRYDIAEEGDQTKLAVIQAKEEKKKKRAKELKRELLSSGFLALEKTIFANFKDIDRIEYRLNGKIKNFPELEYSLTETKKRQ